MKLKEITFLLVRVLALYVAIRGLEQLTNMIQVLYPSIWGDIESSFSTGNLLIMMLATGIILIGIGVVLWFGASRIVKMILGDKEAEVSSLSIRDNTLYTVGLALIGITLLVNNIPALFGYIAKLVEISHMDVAEAFDRNRDLAWIELGVTTVKLVLAAFLIIKPTSLSRFIMGLREVGTGDSHKQE
ncbi:MAG: hypothetical protein K6T85_09640 [Gorillibacterium sp.]|nr:hypothetical protein [Gorillibacterium sp.]